MKRRTSSILTALLLMLTLTFTQGFASGPSGKKTPEPASGQPQMQADQQGKPGDGEKPGKGNKTDKDNPSNNANNPDKGKPDNARGPKDDKTNNGKGPKDSQPDKKEKTVHLRGIVEGDGPDGLSVTLKDGSGVTLLTAGASIHFPGLGKDETAPALKKGDEITAKATKTDKSGVYQAISINVIPGKPSYKHGAGVVTALNVDKTSGAGTITVGGGTFKIKPGYTVFLPDGASAADITVNVTRVTVVCPRDTTGGALVAKAIVILPEKTSDIAPKP